MRTRIPNLRSILPGPTETISIAVNARNRYARCGLLPGAPLASSGRAAVSATTPIQYALVTEAEQEAGDADSDSTCSEQVDKEFPRNFGRCPQLDEIENGWDYLRRTADDQADETQIIGPSGGKSQLCAITATKVVLASPQEAEMLADVGSRAG